MGKRGKDRGRSGTMEEKKSTVEGGGGSEQT